MFSRKTCLRATTFSDFANSILRHLGYQIIQGLEYFRFVLENLEFSKKLYPNIYDLFKEAICRGYGFPNTTLKMIWCRKPELKVLHTEVVFRQVLSDILPAFDEIRDGAQPLWANTVCIRLVLVEFVLRIFS